MEWRDGEGARETESEGKAGELEGEGREMEREAEGEGAEPRAEQKEGDSLDDLPVVPDVVHQSWVSGAPKNLTWKHVLLGAVHNTATGEHRTAQEMCEVGRLVAA